MFEKLQIVVVGGGFGGLYAATYLSRSELAERGAHITLVDRRNYFTFTPLLAEVAAGTLGRQHVTYPYRVLGGRYGFQFVQDAARDIDVSAGVLRTTRTTLSFDYLVIAVGAEPRFFGNENLRHHSLALTSVDDALAIRDRVIGALERATLTTDEQARQRLLTFVVAGAGPAGVEVASEVHTLGNVTLRPYYPRVPPTKVILADGGDRILPGWDGELARAGLTRLRERGIEVRLHTRIADVRSGLVVTTSADGLAEVPANTLIWTAGTAPAPWAAQLAVPTERGAIKINPFLQVQGYENVYAVGDVTTLEDDRAGRPYPRVAPIAISQGIRAAANIENHALGRDLEPYQAHHAGKIISLGAGVALVDLLGIRITGALAWWIYRGAYLLKLVGTKNKIRVLVTLALNRIFEPDITTDAPAPAA
jgi:NADH dehydrogenase